MTHVKAILGTLLVIIWGLVAFVLFGAAITSGENSSIVYAAFFVAFAASCSLLLLPGVLLLRSVKRKASQHEQPTCTQPVRREFERPFNDTAPAVVFSGTVRPLDLIQARQILDPKLTVVFICIALGGGILLALNVPKPTSNLPSNFSTVLMPWLVFVLCFGIMAAIAVRKWLRNPSATRFNGSVDAHSLSISAVTSQSVFLWGHWARTRMTKNTVVLQAHNGQISMFRREWFASSEDWNRFCGYVTNSVKPSGAA